MYWIPRVLMPSVLCFTVMALFAGCEDPTKNKPAALVTESKSEPSDTVQGAETKLLAFTDSTSVSFVGSKVTGSHDGGFNTVTGSVALSGEDLTQARIDVLIDMNSIWSDNDRLTNHLKNADFFEVETYPEARFVSNGIEKAAAGYTVSGDLTLHGVTKNISFPATMSLENGTLKANAEFSINRMDFGVAYAGKADDLIRENVLIKLDIEAA